VGFAPVDCVFVVMICSVVFLPQDISRLHGEHEAQAIEPPVTPLSARQGRTCTSASAEGSGLTGGGPKPGIPIRKQQVELPEKLETGGLIASTHANGLAKHCRFRAPAVHRAERREAWGILEARRILDPMPARRHSQSRSTSGALAMSQRVGGRHKLGFGASGPVA
jgi:hypothetical protein